MRILVYHLDALMLLFLGKTILPLPSIRFISNHISCPSFLSYFLQTVRHGCHHHKKIPRPGRQTFHLFILPEKTLCDHGPSQDVGNFEGGSHIHRTGSRTSRTRYGHRSCILSNTIYGRFRDLGRYK